ncbi:MAG: hypothetical protein MJ239_01680 [Bacilli bacterium]|nr:hypothetical protein [Bacilli bacterium]
MKKRILKTLSVSFLLFSCGLVSACSNGGNVSSSSTVAPAFEVKLNKSEIKLTIGDKSQLVATNSDESEVKYVWSSSNSSVVTVDESGRIEAIRNGEAVISASYGGSIATCTVSVTSGLLVPSLHFVNEVEAVEQVTKGSTLNLQTMIKFNGKDFYDVNASYFVTNPEAGSIENGIFTAGNKANVSTDIIVNARWRNFDSPSLSMEIRVDIISLKNIYLNNGDLGDVSLFTVDHIGSADYKVSQEITSIDAEEDGVAMPIQSVEVIDNKSSDNPSLPSVDFVYDASTKKGSITSIRQGSAILKVSFLDSSSNVYSKSFNITVNLPVLEIEEWVPYFSLDDGLFYDESTDSMKSLGSLFPAGSTNIVKAYQDGRALTVDGDKVLDVGSTSSTSFGTAELTVYNEVMAIKVRTQTYQRVIDEVSDFTNFYSADTKGAEVTGYFVVVKDLVDKTNHLAMPAGKYPSTFAGTLEGLGHKVSVYLDHAAPGDEWGLFGNSFKGTIKNIAFADCEMQAAFAGLIAHHCDGGATIKDVYLNNTVHSTSSTPAFGVFYSTYGFLKISQSIIHVPATMESNYNHGAFGIHKLATGSGNFYIVSPKSNGIGQTDRFKNYIYQTEADADTEFAGTKFVMYPSALWYPRFAEMDEAKNDYSTFNPDVWNFESGVPVFKGLNYYSK